MFEPGTILELRQPRSKKDKPYAYDRVEIVGQSPVQHAGGGASPWAGADAFGWLLRPAGEAFGPVVDKPYGEINRDYTVVEWPTDPQTGEPLKPENNPRGRPSPEQVFAMAAEANAKNYAERRPRRASVQVNEKSPEQVLREQAQQARQEDQEAE